MKFIFSLIFALVLSDNVFGWGANGHRVIGLVAEQHLTPAAKSKINELLQGNSLAEVSTWMDDIRSDTAYNHTHDWHWVTIPDNSSYEKAFKNPKGDVIGKIEDFTKALKNRNLPPAQEQEFLKYLVHLVGDLHQPLHVGSGDDQGGNVIRVTWFGKVSNLHKVWDSDIIESKELSFTELTYFLGVPDKELVKQWQSTTVRDWAKESMMYRPQVYNIPKDAKLSYKYVYENYPTVELRLQQAGVRLAGILNEIYG